MQDKYFAFIASSYSITFLVLAGLIVWAFATHSSRRNALARLEEKGFSRVGKSD
ncbi:MAG: heme exporter protein CcmD [Pseudomonadota bacterium]